MNAAATFAAFVALAVTAGVIGWLYGRGLIGRRNESQPPPQAPEQPANYYAGIDSLINEQPDRAVEIFTRLVEVDEDTIETHFALGSLYRRRGEVDRAIRIHENILARPNLSADHKQQALWALAQDFLRAGVLDRSEKLLQELATKPSHRNAALLALLRVYETEGEWAQAVATHRELPAAIAAERSTAVAHYHCELAGAAIKQGKLNDARRFLRHARRLAPRFARASLMRAELAAGRRAHDLAARLLLRALDDDWNLLLEAMPPLIEAVARTGHERHLDTLVAQAGRQRNRASDLAQALLLADVPVQGALADVVESFVAAENQFSEILGLIEAGGAPRSAEDRRRAVRAVLRHAARGQRYQCANCGFASQALFWQCPGCREWDGMKPIWMLPPGTGAARRR